MQPPFIFAATFSTADLAGKSVPILVPPGVIAISFFMPPLFQNRIGQLKLFPADDRFRVILHQVLIKLSPVLMAVKSAFHIGLLKQDVTRILFILDDAIDVTRRPMPPFLVATPRSFSSPAISWLLFHANVSAKVYFTISVFSGPTTISPSTLA